MSTFSVVSEATDWSAVAFVNEICEALEERRMAVFPSSASYQVAAGTDVQSASFWSAIQTQLQDIAIWFCDPDIDLDGMDDSGDPGAAVPNTHNWDLSTWRSASILPSGGFRRATTYPADWTDLDDDAYDYGVMQVGDIIGPWIFEDLQRGLAALNSAITYAPYAQYVHAGAPVSHEGHGAGYGKTIAAAIISVQSSWNYQGWNPYAGVGYPRMYANIVYGATYKDIYTGKETGYAEFQTSAHNITSCDVYLFDFFHGNHGFNVIPGGPGTIDVLVPLGKVGSGTTLSFFVGESPGGNRMPALDVTFPESGPDLNYSLKLTHAVFRSDFAFKWQSS